MTTVGARPAGGLILALAGLVLACDDDSTGPGQRLDIELAGRAERSATVLLSVTFQGDAVDDSLLEWSADPAAAVTFLTDSTARFDSAGDVTLRVEAEIAGRLESGEGDFTIAVPPVIVFDLLRDGNRDIYSIELDGQNLIRWTTAAGDDLDPTTAGGTLVFTSFRDGNAELYSRPLAAGGDTRLTTTDDDEVQPAIAPDGTRLSYAYNISGVHRIWVANADGDNATEVTAGFGTGGSIEASPSWDPAGGEIVFVSTTGGTSDIYRLDVDGGMPSILVPGADAEVEPAWSPDGQDVVFASDRTGDTELFLQNILSHGITQLTDRAGADGEPAWLPDGRIVYTEFSGASSALRWLDPEDPDTVFEIPVGVGDPRRPAGVFP